MALTRRALRIAVLVKQIPLVEDMRLGEDGRLVRDAIPLEMSAFCRRAVSKAVELAEARPGSSVTAFTLGPPAAEDALREAIAWGADHAVPTRGVLVCDPAFRGSDTIATARALAAALRHEGGYDLVLTGRNSLDADTGQVPPQLAELLDLPFAAGAKEVLLEGDVLSLGCEHDDSWVEAEVRLPAVVSCAERLCAPAKVPPEQRADVPGELITMLGVDDLGPGPWGAAGSLTTVGACHEMAVDRLRRCSPEAPVATQVKEAVGVLLDRDVLGAGTAAPRQVVPATGGAGPVIAVIAEPGDDVLATELCGLAARLAAAAGGSTALLAPVTIPADRAGSWGADRLLRVTGWAAEEDIARAVTGWAASARPWGILAGSTAYGREIASRVAVSLEAGLTGDAIDVDLVTGELVAWKPAFGGQLVAAVTATSPVWMATIRPGVIPSAAPRDHVAEISQVDAEPRGRVLVRTRRREVPLEGLGGAGVVIGVGSGVAQQELGQLEELRELLGAEFGCTRRVTDAGHMPHGRQIGITGRSVSPRLYVAIGTSGKFNHMSGVRAAGTVLAVNPDPDAPVWRFSDVGVVARWQECVPLLVAALREAGAPR